MVCILHQAPLVTLETSGMSRRWRLRRGRRDGDPWAGDLRAPPGGVLWSPAAVCLLSPPGPRHPSGCRRTHRRARPAERARASHRSPPRLASPPRRPQTPPSTGATGNRSHLSVAHQVLGEQHILQRVWMQRCAWWPHPRSQRGRMRQGDCPECDVGLGYIVRLKPLKQATRDPVSKTN